MGSAWVPPRWFVTTAWKVHRRMVRVSGGRRGLWAPKPGKWGTLRLSVPGRKTGVERGVILGYIEDGPDLVTLAMNGWAAPEPAWWLNLLAHPEAQVDLEDGSRPVVAHAATGEERERLWARWREVNDKLDDFATRRPTETAVVVLAPRPEG